MKEGAKKQKKSKKEFITGSGKESNVAMSTVHFNFPLVKITLHIKVLLDYMFFLKIKREKRSADISSDANMILRANMQPRSLPL